MENDLGEQEKLVLKEEGRPIKHLGRILEKARGDKNQSTAKGGESFVYQNRRVSRRYVSRGRKICRFVGGNVRAFFFLFLLGL